MSTYKDDSLRHCPQRRPRTPTTHARVAGPLLAALVAQIFAITVAVLIGLPLGATVLVALGVAAFTAMVGRRTLGSLLAGAGIRVARPYLPGEQIRLYVPSLNSVQDAEVVRVGPANTTLMTASGIVLVPNSQMLRGPAAH